MDKQIRSVQIRTLQAIKQVETSFALAGGTALELYYLHHRFSRDLDFFSPDFSAGEVKKIIKAVQKETGAFCSLQAEYNLQDAAIPLPDRAYVMVWNLKMPEIESTLKVDFVEDVLFQKPKIRKFKGVRTYDVRNIYYQKISAITGSRLKKDGTGREIPGGRNEARDAFDVYFLSKKIEPLHIFLKTMPRHYHRGMVFWWRSFSRMDLKLGLLDLDTYESKPDTREIINLFDNEMKKFAEEQIL